MEACRLQEYCELWEVCKLQEYCELREVCRSQEYLDVLEVVGLYLYFYHPDPRHELEVCV